MATARPRPRLPISPSPVGRGLFSPEYQQVRTALYGSPPQSPVVASPMRRLLPFGAPANPRVPTFQDQTSPPPGMGLGGMGPGMGTLQPMGGTLGTAPLGMGTLPPMGGTLGTAPLGRGGGQMPQMPMGGTALGMAGGIGSLLTGNQTQQPAQNVGQQPNTLQQGAGRLF